MNPGNRLAAACTTRNLTLATAESCTGGGLSHLVTAIPGASAFFVGGVIAYQNDVKSRFLDVPVSTLQQYGAVSSQTARAMAEGCQRRFESDIAVSITGIAGPGGGSRDKPVGTVHIAVVFQGKTRAVKFHFQGDRSLVRAKAVSSAVDLILETIDE